MPFSRAQARNGHGPPRSLICASIFLLPSGLCPEPQVEQIPLAFSPHALQFIPHAPVGMIISLFFSSRLVFILPNL